MRVLYLNPFSQEVSGPDESLRALLAQLIPVGVEAHVVLPAPGPQVERYQALGAAVHFAPLAVLRRDCRRRRLLYPCAAARAPRRAVHAHRPRDPRRLSTRTWRCCWKGGWRRGAAASRTCCTTAATR